MVLAEARPPIRIEGRHLLANAGTNAELDGMALAIVETDRLHAREPLQRPRETDG